MAEKRTERLTVWMPESMFRDLSSFAHAEDRKLSDTITLIIGRHLYGNLRRDAEEVEVENSRDARR